MRTRSMNRSKQSQNTLPTGSKLESVAVTRDVDTETPRRVTDESVDVFRLRQEQAVNVLRQSDEFNNSLRANGIPWGKLIGILKEALPETMDDGIQSLTTSCPKR